MDCRIGDETRGKLTELQYRTRLVTDVTLRDRHVLVLVLWSCPDYYDSFPTPSLETYPVLPREMRFRANVNDISTFYRTSSG